MNTNEASLTNSIQFEIGSILMGNITAAVLGNTVGNTGKYWEILMGNTGKY